MQTVSTGDRALVDALAPVTLHIYAAGEALDADIISAEYLASCAGGESLTIGNACSAALKLVLDGGGFDLYGKAVTVKWSVSDTEYSLIQGTVPERPTVNNGQTTAVIYDAMYTAGAKLYTPVSASCTVASALSDLAGQMGVALETLPEAASSLTLSGGTAALTEVSRAQAAGDLAMLLGCSAVISRSGALAMAPYTVQAVSAVPYSAGAQGDEAEYTVTGLTFQATAAGADGDQSVEYSAGDGTLTLANPLASQAAVDYACSVLWGTTIHGGIYSIPGGLLLEPGDIITVQAADGDFSAGCMSLSMALDGGVKTTITSLGEGRTGVGAAGTIAQALKMLQADVGEFKKLKAKTIEVRDEAGNLILLADAETGQFVANSGATGGFTIGRTALYNGPSSLSDSETEGVYLGTDGIQSNDGAGSYVNIAGGIVNVLTNIAGSTDQVWAAIGSSRRPGFWTVTTDASGETKAEAYLQPDGAMIGGDIYAYNGSVTAYKSSAPHVIVTNGTRKISLHIGSGGTNRGVYDDADATWILYRGSGGTYIPDALFVGGHSSAVGTIASDSTLAVPGVDAATTTTLTTLALTEGKYLLSGQVVWTSVSSARTCTLSLALSNVLSNDACQTTYCAANNTCRQNVSRVISVGSAGTTIYLTGMSTVAGNITAAAIDAIRIA